MSDFSLTRNRDASSAIAGYVYQVDLIIERWLNLQTGQILELERGEDIDLISQYFSQTDLKKRERRLEQVKRLTKSLTLRTPEAIEAIANFTEHLKNNPASNLVFCYTTTSVIGKERSSPMPNRIAAITAWEEIRSGKCSQAQKQNYLKGIQVLLSSAKQPDDLPVSSWDIFQNFIKNAKEPELSSFISKFEWSTGSPDFVPLQQYILQLLQRHKHATSPEQAQSIYEKLFSHVFHLLSKVDLKQLTLEGLHTLLAGPPLGERDKAELERIFHTLHSIQSGIDELKQGQSQLASSLSGQHNWLLEKYQELKDIADYHQPTLFLEPPPLVIPLSYRTEAVNSLKEELYNHSLVALYGEIDSGKTQLARLVLENWRPPYLWINFHNNYDTQRAGLELDNACKSLVKTPLLTHAGLYQQLCDQLGSEALIVLDNLPRILTGDELEMRLLTLVRICKATGARVLTTTSYLLPASLQASLDPQDLVTFTIPEFSDQEVQELFQAYGVNEGIFSTKFISSINSLARRHPRLVVAIMNKLQQENWSITNTVFDSIFFKKDYAREINSETIQLLLNQITDPSTRNLLYRINLIASSFTLEEVTALAQIEPPIDLPQEHLSKLLGPWVQPETINRWRVSALIKFFDNEHLAIQTQRKCQLLLAERILQKGRIDQWDTFNAFNYYASAEEFEKAGRLLISALVELSKIEELVAEPLLLALWYGLPLPTTMELGTRLVLRALQIAVRHKYGKPTIELVSDLFKLLQQATVKEWRAVLLVAVNAPLNARKANYYTALALSLWSQSQAAVVEIPDQKELAQKDPALHEMIIWLHTQTFSSLTDVQEWLATLQYLTSLQRRAAFANPLAELVCLNIIDKIWLQEAQKPKEQQDWETLISGLDELARHALQLDLELLWGFIIRAKIVILADYQNNLNGAKDITELALIQTATDSRVKFLLQECLGRQYAYKNQNREALIWLNKALEQPITSYPSLQVQTLLWAGAVVSNEDTRTALDYCQRAVDIARSSEEVPEFLLIKALVELSIALWRVGKVKVAYEPMEQAAQILLSLKSEQSNWQGLLVLYSNILGYFTKALNTNKVIKPTSSDKIFLTPEPGLFLKDIEKYAAHYNELQVELLPLLLSRFAEDIGNDEQAAYWATQGLEVSATTTKNSLILFRHRMLAIPQLSVNDCYAEVLEIALEGGAIMKAIDKQDQTEPQAISPSTDLYQLIDVEASLGSKPNSLWRQAERLALEESLLPIVFRLGYLALTDKELCVERAREVTALYLQIILTAAAPDLWTSAAQLLDQIFLQKLNFENLIQVGNKFYNREQWPLSLVAFLGASLADNAIPKTALSADLYILPYICHRYRASTTYRRLIWPFVYTFWSNKLKKQAFHLSLRPSLVLSDLENTQKEAEEVQVLTVLKVIMRGLGGNTTFIEEQWKQNTP